MKDATFYRLKAGADDLVTRCGGQKRSGAILGVSQQQMSKICSRDDGNMLSIRAKLMLEQDCGVPLLTSAEADLLGYRLEPVAPLAMRSNDGTPFTAHSQVMVEVADLARTFARAVEDGVYSGVDALHCGKAISDLKHAIEAFERVNAATLAACA